jgi:hypothetical protein
VPYGKTHFVLSPAEAGRGHAVHFFDVIEAGSWRLVRRVAASSEALPALDYLQRQKRFFELLESLQALQIIVSERNERVSTAGGTYWRPLAATWSLSELLSLSPTPKSKKTRADGRLRRFSTTGIIMPSEIRSAAWCSTAMAGASTLITTHSIPSAW